jgi:hypothetical protein
VCVCVCACACACECVRVVVQVRKCRCVGAWSAPTSFPNSPTCDLRQNIWQHRRTLPHSFYALDKSVSGNVRRPCLLTSVCSNCGIINTLQQRGRDKLVKARPPKGDSPCFSRVVFPTNAGASLEFAAKRTSLDIKLSLFELHLDAATILEGYESRTPKCVIMFALSHHRRPRRRWDTDLFKVIVVVHRQAYKCKRAIGSSRFVMLPRLDPDARAHAHAHAHARAHA